MSGHAAAPASTVLNSRRRMHARPPDEPSCTIAHRNRDGAARDSPSRGTSAATRLIGPGGGSPRSGHGWGAPRVPTGATPPDTYTSWSLTQGTRRGLHYHTPTLTNDTFAFNTVIE